MSERESELVLNADGSVYHLKLKAEHIADHVILVGDPGRVEVVSKQFDHIEHQISNREFTTHTGMFEGTRITALSTGIGTDNIDIVVNELDAAVNMDNTTRQPLEQKRSLNLIRLGTCGSLQASLEVESTVVTEYSMGLDGIRHFYDMPVLEAEERLEQAFQAFMDFPSQMNTPYAAQADQTLLGHFQHLGSRGITMTANGFFGPQGRRLRIPLADDTINETYGQFEWNDLRILNYEMESSALYSLGRALGHKCLCMCVVVANRKAGKFSSDYKPAVEQLIRNTLKTCTLLN